MTLEKMLDTMAVDGTVSLDVWDGDDRYVETVGPGRDDNDVSSVDDFVPYYGYEVAGFHFGVHGNGEGQTVIDVKPSGDSEAQTVPAPDFEGLARVADLLARNVRWNMEAQFQDSAWAASLRIEAVREVLTDFGIDCQLRDGRAYVGGVESTETF